MKKEHEIKREKPPKDKKLRDEYIKNLRRLRKLESGGGYHVDALSPSGIPAD